MIITIDGPAGAGKSSAARKLAQRLGFEFLDTGAMFRAVTLMALRAQIDLTNQESLERLIAGMHLEMPPGRVVVNGEDITGLIRTPEVSTNSSPIAESKVVRRHLAALQRQIADNRNMVCEGRDQGTAVFPEAFCKFFLSAEPNERARRRQRELQERGERVDFEELLRAQEIRDRRDAARDIAPMVPAADAIILDSTGLTLDQVVESMVQHFQRKRSYSSADR